MSAKPEKPASRVDEMRTVIKRGAQVWSMISPRRRRTFILAAALMSVTSAANVAVPLWMGGLVDTLRGIEPTDSISRIPRYVGHAVGLIGDFAWKQKGAPDSQLGKIVPGNLLFGVSVSFLAMIAFAFLLKEALSVLQRYLVQNTTTRIEKEITIKLVDHLMRADLNKLSSERVGALHGRIRSSVEGFTRFLKLTFLDFVPAIVLATLALSAALSKQWMVAAAMAAVVPMSFFITGKQLAAQKGGRLALMRKKQALDGTLVEQLGGIEYIRAANTHEIELARIETVAEQRRVQELKYHLNSSYYGALKAMNEAFFHILVIMMAIFMAVRGVISIGDIIVMSGLFTTVMHPVREVHRILDEAHESSMEVGDLMELLQLPVDNSFDLPTIHEPRVAERTPVIRVQNLTVDYSAPDGRVRRALDDVSLEIFHGETIGVAGPSGSGKSTWLKVMMRLIHPSEGAAFIGGEPINAVSRESIGRLVGYASQTPFMFSGTIRENIAYGTPSATDDDIRRVAKLACIDEEIALMPGGFDANVSERGGNLSGGQRQRIALARIFLKNPAILVLDEGTAALDNISERRVQEAIAGARADRTTIIVAHRLSTLRDADRIYVFARGKLVESGSYEALHKAGGVFTSLVKSAES
jgi:ATP-binding cassette subfamily B protein